MKLFYEQAEKILAKMTTEQKVGQMIMASIEVTEMDDKTRKFLRDNYVGNIILFGKNCIDRAQLAKLNQQIQDEVTSYTEGVQALLSIDQEGGNVTRIRNGATVFSCAAAVGSTKDADLAYLTGHIMGNEMRSLGIAFNLAPVLDISGARVGRMPHRRSFGPTGSETALYGGAYARGLRDTGVIDCGKHFPGSGDSTVDTHFATSIVNTPAEELIEKSVKPFKKVVDEGLRAIMTSHACYMNLDPSGVPATISRKILQELVRGDMGFEGLIISDGMQMLAIADVYGAPHGCVLAAEAGCDFVIVGNGGDNADPDGDDVQTPCVKAMLEAVRTGELSMERVNESARRIIAYKLMLGDMRPEADVVTRDWRAHEAFARALAEMCVEVKKDDAHMLPLPEGALFLSRISRARLGVEEGDHLVAGFAPMAARICGGDAIEFEDHPDLDALKDRIAQAPAVVFGVANNRELTELMDDLRTVCQLNPKTCFVDLDVPEAADRVDFAPCVITSYDQTASAIRAICKALKG